MGTGKRSLLLVLAMLLISDVAVGSFFKPVVEVFEPFLSFCSLASGGHHRVFEQCRRCLVS